MIWNFCIRRPVLTVVLFLALAIFGLYGYFQMPVRETPDVEFPIVSVNVVLPGAEPEVIETEIIEPLESQLNTIEGLKEMTATAREQVASIVAEFELWRDIDIATQDARDRVDRARRELPDGIEAPIVQKLDPDAQAIMWITLTGDERWDPVRMTEYADKVLKERLEGMRGVGQIRIGGGRAYAVRVVIDPERLAAHGLTVQDIVATIQRNNVDIPSGRVESERREFLVKVAGQFSEPGPMNDLVITVRDGGPIRISDVAEVVDGVENDRQIARFSGEPTVGLGVVKQSDANLVALADAVRLRMEELARDFPPGLTYRIATDDSRYVEDSIDDLVRTIFLATGLVVLVVLAFLRTARGTLITSLAIPTSLLGGLAVIYALGFTLNNLTMLALILVIGIVVDDAIVVLESCFRHMEHGAEAKPAARTGTTEVAFAAIANSLSLAAVFIPVAFTKGIIGRFFYEFGLTVAITVFASTFTALTLTPMLCSRFLRVPERHGVVFRATEAVFRGLERAYVATLRIAFRLKPLTILLAVVAIAAGGFFFSRISKEFSPDVDRASLMLLFETPEGATLAETDELARAIERVLADTPEVAHQFLAIGLSRGGPGRVNEGISFVHLTPVEERERHQTEVMQELRGRLSRLPLGRVIVLPGGGAGMGQGQPIQVVLQSDDLDELAEVQEGVMQWMRARPDYVGVDTNLKMNKPQASVSIDRDKASELGLTVADISNALRFLLGEPPISEIERQGERYDVITEVVGAGRMVPDALRDIYVRGAGGTLVALGNVVRVEETIGPSEIHHFNRRRNATVSASTPAGVAMGDALARLEEHLDGALPATMSHTLTGQAQDFQESFYYLSVALAFAIVFVFLVLAGQFESFLHPFTILLTIPLATVGAFGALWLLDMTFNVFSFIGLIMLLGMATKNGILMIDYTNVLVARGDAIEDAARRAARTRFRPVLMTTISTVLGMLPIAIGYGAGGEARAPLGVAVGSGLLATTFLTLVVIPVVHTLFGRLRARVLGTEEDEPRRGRPDRDEHAAKEDDRESDA